MDVFAALLFSILVVVGIPAGLLWLLFSRFRSHRRLVREHEAEFDRRWAELQAQAQAREARFAQNLAAFRADASARRPAAAKGRSRRRAGAAAGAAAGATASDASSFAQESDQTLFDDSFDCGSCDLRDLNYTGEWHDLTDE